MFFPFSQKILSDVPLSGVGNRGDDQRFSEISVAEVSKL